MKEEKITENFAGYKIFSTSSCVEHHNGKVIEKTIRKAFQWCTLYIVKVKGLNYHLQLYKDEMYY